MFTLKQATLLALVGSAFAAPLARRDGPYGRLPGSFGFSSGGTTGTVVDTVPTTTTEESVTIITIYPDAPSAPAASVSVAAPAAPSVPATPVSTGSSGSDTGYMAIVNEYRTAGGLPALTQSSQLEANALKTAQDGHGEMKHELNPGSMAQVLAPGNANNFENVYVGGWLCEIPSLPGIDCAKFSGGWSHDGQTGHAKILTNEGYHNIGCALADGIWACDLS